MGLLNKKKTAVPAHSAQLLDYRKHDRLVAAISRRREVAQLLSTLSAEDLPRAASAEAEAASQLEAMDVQVLGGRAPESDLARYKAAVNDKRRERALIQIRLDDLRKEAEKLDREIPDLDFVAKCQATRDLQVEALGVMQGMLSALEGVPAMAARLDEIRQLAHDQFPVTHHSADPQHDYRFPAYAAIPLVALSSRIKAYSAGGLPYMTTQVSGAGEVSAPIIAELRDAITHLEDAMKASVAKASVGDG